MVERAKTELIRNLAEFGRHGDIRMRGERPFCLYFADWLKKHPTNDKYYVGTGIFPYLPQLITDAFENLRVGEDESTLSRRQSYLREKERDTLPEILNIESGGLDRVLTISKLSSLMGKVTGYPWVETQIESYLKGQDTVLEQEFNGFVKRVYLEGLADLHEQSRTNGMRGVFDLTHLRGFTTAGRLMLTFARKDDNGHDSHSISFVGEDGDIAGLRFGTQSIYAPLDIATGMIRDVIRNWPQEPNLRAEIYHPDRQVSIL